MIKHRYADTDIMRIISSFFIVLLHTSAYFYGTNTPYRNNIYFLDILSRFAMPVFVIISGRYMIEQNHSVSYLLKKSVKMLSIMLITSLVYCTDEYFSGNIYFSNAREYIYYIFTEPIHLWYIYSCIFLYIFTPVFSVFAKRATKRQLSYMLFMCFLFGSVIYTLIHTSGFAILKKIMEKCNTECKLGFIGCYMLGYYFYRFPVTQKCRYLIYILGIIAAAASLTCGACVPFKSKADEELLISFFAPNILAQSIAFFVFIQSLKINPKHMVSCIIRNMSQCTFIIYLLHILILRKISVYAPCNINVRQVLILTVVVYAVSAAIAELTIITGKYIYKKIATIL